MAAHNKVMPVAAKSTAKPDFFHRPALDETRKKYAMPRKITSEESVSEPHFLINNAALTSIEGIKLQIKGTGTFYYFLLIKPVGDENAKWIKNRGWGHTLG